MKVSSTEYKIISYNRKGKFVIYKNGKVVFLGTERKILRNYIDKIKSS